MKNNKQQFSLNSLNNFFKDKIFFFKESSQFCFVSVWELYLFLPSTKEKTLRNQQRRGRKEKERREKKERGKRREHEKENAAKIKIMNRNLSFPISPPLSLPLSPSSLFKGGISMSLTQEYK